MPRWFEATVLPQSPHGNVTGPGLSFTSPDKRSNIDQKAVGLQCFKINLGVAWVSTLNFGVLTMCYQILSSPKDKLEGT